MSSRLRIWEKGKQQISPGRGCRPNKPKRLNVSCSNQIEGFRAEQTQCSYLSLNLSVTAEIVAFFRKFKCERSIKDSALLPFHARPPSLDELNAAT